MGDHDQHEHDRGEDDGRARRQPRIAGGDRPARAGVAQPELLSGRHHGAIAAIGGRGALLAGA